MVGGERERLLDVRQDVLRAGMVGSPAFAMSFARLGLVAHGADHFRRRADEIEPLATTGSANCAFSARKP